MGNERFIPQADAEQVSRGVQKARYLAYMQCVRKIKMRAERDKNSRGAEENAGGMA